RFLRVFARVRSEILELFGAGDSVVRLFASSATNDEAALDEVVQDPAYRGLVIITKASQELGPRRRLSTRQIAMNRGPEGHAARGRRFAEALALLPIGAKSETEHVGDHLLA